MDLRTRKLTTIYKVLHVRDDFDRRNVLRKEGGRGFTCIEDNVDTSIQRLEEYIQNRGGRLIIVTRNNTDITRTNRTREKKQITKVGRKTTLWTI